MGTEFTPDYKNIELAARNIEAPRLPLYEHIICVELMEKVLGRKFGGLLGGSYADKVEFFRNFCEFHRMAGYDSPSFECCIGGAFIDGGALGGHKEGAIKDMDDFNRYPWDEIEERYFTFYDEYFRALAEALPAGMKAVGGVGNGVFECVQDLTGYINLCFISADDPELYEMLFHRIGELMRRIWERFLAGPYSDAFCVMRFGDDLGYKSNTLLSADDIRRLVIPEYKKVISLVHGKGKPFLLHSCGCIFSVMDDLIDAGINAKHSNEDEIAPFPVWVERYGDRIGNFGGIDTDAVCRLSYPEMKDYITEVIAKCSGHGGFAFASGNSIPNYVPVEGFLYMNRIVREIRGDTLPKFLLQM
jgi:uroporphyrinogen decarboxylase